MTPKEHASQLYNTMLRQLPEEETEKGLFKNRLIAKEMALLAVDNFRMWLWHSYPVKYGHDHWLNVNKELLEL
jgi:hypothetical protein